MSLDDRYRLEQGRVFLSGVQALVRVIVDQRRADRIEGLSTAAFVCGYQGSPLGGLDIELGRNRALLDPLDVTHRPGLNEELAATAVSGTQLAPGLPGARVQGVLGVWYGKAPGLDRATDALRHANLVGTSPAGGAVALVGDDPASKSSTVPSASEAALADLGMPTFYPGTVQEALDLGRHAIACSRASGLWSAIKVVTNVADAAATAEVGLRRVAPRRPGPRDGERRYVHRPHARLLPPHTLELERTLVGERLDLARRYVELNGLNPVSGAREAWFGVIAAGRAYRDLRQALEDLGVDDRELERMGVRLMRLGALYPADPEGLRRFARGLEEILVVEDKRPFVETQVRDALYGAAAPMVLGKRDESGAELLPAAGELDADVVARALAGRLSRRLDGSRFAARLEERHPTEAERAATLPARTPFFCSGCPHNASTRAPHDTLVGAGIGCHTMVLLNPEGKGELTGITQMGGEGAQWIGMAPFTDREHFVQNIGDGTWAHSGSLALRFAVAAGVNVTYKLLYNEAVAMTGGQHIEGGMAVPELTRALELEGVARTIVTTEDPGGYRRARLAANAEVRDRSQLAAAEAELARVPGVTVLVHDQACAAERRRLRKRGLAPQPDLEVVINERVCEGCGDCGEKSGCLSVQPVETELGRKTRIHQSSCNTDLTCLQGDCPSFVTIAGARSRRALLPTPPPPALDDAAPEPVVPADDFRVRMVGVGGTGVVTVSQVLAVASLIAGRHVSSLDQTGLSQKGGPVVSDVRIARAPLEGSNRASRGGADVLLAFDPLAAAAPHNLAVADGERTVAVISTSEVPTGEMVVESGVSFPPAGTLARRIAAATRPGAAVTLDAEALSQALFGDHMPANAIALGAAWQAGAIPLPLAAIQEAFELNGVAVQRNLSALAWGRACVAVPAEVEAVVYPPREDPPLDAGAAALIAETGAEGELRRLLELRVPDLIAYANERYAREYAAFVAEVLEAESRRAPGSTAVTEAFARELHRLMAYKDEYEVARLHLDAAEQAVRDAARDGGRVYWHLHPPLLRALGMRRKLRLGPWFRPVLRLLRRGRRLRGTPLDPFGHTRVRAVERALPGEYRDAVREALALLGAGTHGRLVALCELPEVVRGYEQIKLDSVARYREMLAAALDDLRADHAHEVAAA